MIITRSHELEQAFVKPPMAGRARTARYLKANKSIFDEFVLNLSNHSDDMDAPVLAITVECDSVRLTSEEVSMRRTSDRYKFSIDLNSQWRREHVQHAVQSGLLVPLASIQWFVRRVNVVTEQDTFSATGKLRFMMTAIEADAETVAKIISNIHLGR